MYKKSVLTKVQRSILKEKIAEISFIDKESVKISDEWAECFFNIYVLDEVLIYKIREIAIMSSTVYNIMIIDGKLKCYFFEKNLEKFLNI